MSLKNKTLLENLRLASTMAPVDIAGIMTETADKAERLIEMAKAVLTTLDASAKPVATVANLRAAIDDFEKAR